MIQVKQKPRYYTRHTFPHERATSFPEGSSILMAPNLTDSLVKKCRMETNNHKRHHRFRRPALAVSAAWLTGPALLHSVSFT